MKRILVTGACGSIGEELVSKLIRDGFKVCAFDNSEDRLFHLNKKFNKHKNSENLRVFLGDIRDKNRLFQAMQGIEEIYHCAALKHVELSEYNPFEALKTNVIGTNNLIEVAQENKVKKILFTSSDKAVNPSSMMGTTKLLGEKLAISANNYTGSDDIKFGCVRFGNVWNTNGSVGPIFKNQINLNKDLTLTNKLMSRFFITKEEAVNLCINACNSLIGGEIFVPDMGVAKLGDIADEFNKYNKKIKIKEIGAQAGEKFYEELFTEIEGDRAYRYKGMYVILPENIDNKSTRYIKLLKVYKKGKPVSIALRSDSPLNKKVNIKKLVKELMHE